MLTLWALTLLGMTSSSLGVIVIDLTYPLKEGENILWPIYPKYNFTIIGRGQSNLTGTWLEHNKFSMAEHTGTHMDAPSHFTEGHWRIHQIPASRLVGPGCVIDVTEKVNGNIDYGVTVQDIKDWEAINGKLPRGAVVLMRSGWGKRYPSKERVFNTDKVDDPSTYHYPAYTPEAAQWLATERDVIAVGGDVPSPDMPTQERYPVHEILLKNDIMLLENVANVDRMPVTGTTVVLGVMNIYEGSGAPMRVLALLELGSPTSGTSGSGMLGHSHAIFLAAGGLYLALRRLV